MKRQPGGRGRGPRFLDGGALARLAEAYGDGVPPRDLAERFGISAVMVREMLKRKKLDDAIPGDLEGREPRGSK